MEKRKLPPAGIKEVAEAANISISTVSRFFNHPELLSKRTNEKIRTAIEELGFIRNRLAGTLMSRSSGTIGLIVPTIDNAIFSEMIQAFTSRMQQLHRITLIASYGYDLNKEIQLVESLLERKTDGIALVGVQHREKIFDLISLHGIPAIITWNYREKSRLPCVGIDNRAMGVKMAEHLYGLGHRNVLFLFPETRNNDRASDRFEGALSYFKQKGVKFTKKNFMNCPYHINLAREKTMAILKEEFSFTAILCGNDVIAQGAIYAALELGIKVPGQISITGMGDFQASAAMVPSLTTIRIPAHRIGRSAADLLVEMIENKEPESAVSANLQSIFKQRSSTGFV